MEKEKTQINEIGKQEVLNRLFKETSYTNNKENIYSGLYKFKSSKKEERASTIVVNKTMLEGIDFNLIYTPLQHLGYKAALYAMGFIYAKCYNPISLSFTIAISSRFMLEDVELLWSGILEAAKEHKIENLSLDLKPSLTGLTIAISAVGIQSNKALESRAAIDNTSLICLTGNLGAAYMGLHVLEREKVAFNKLTPEQAKSYKQPDLSKYKYILSQYLKPEIHPDTVNQFKEVNLLPSTGYFITNGLASSILDMCKEHNVGAKIYLSRMPIATQTSAMAQELSIDTTTAALNGGDDYKFIFIVPITEHERFHKEFPNVDIIGHLCKPEVGAQLVTPDGAEISLRAQGY